MSIHDYKSKKLNRLQAKKLIGEIVQNNPGNVSFTNHALIEAKKDRLSTVDIWNVLESPSARINDEPEEKYGCWRYRYETDFIMVVIEFENDGKGFVVVTVWDKRRRSKV